MKKLLLTAGLILASWSAQALPLQEICSTSSNGYDFEQTGRNARDRVLRQCVNNRRTDQRECQQNLRCYNDDDGDDNYGNAEINGRFRYCQSRDLCTYDITWSAYNNVVVLVDAHEGRGLQLFACDSGSGSQMAPWIAPGKTYTFSIYESDRCSRDVGRYESPSDSVQIRGRRN